MISEWRCVYHNKWSPEGLKIYYGNKRFKLNNSDEIITMADFLDSTKKELSSQFYEEMVMNIIKSEGNIPTVTNNINLNVNNKPSISITHSDPLYIFDPTFEVDNEEMLSDYDIPEMFRNITNLIDEIPSTLINQPNYRWFLAGHQYSGSELHIDPLGSSAWNGLVVGKKLWVIIEPSDGNSYNNSNNNYN